MKVPPRLKQWLRPSLGKVGLLGITLCLALGAYAPAAPIKTATAIQPQAPQPALLAQAAVAPATHR